MRAATVEDLAQRTQASLLQRMPKLGIMPEEAILCADKVSQKTCAEPDMGLRTVHLPRTCRCLGFLSSGLCLHDAVTASPSLSLLLRIAAWGIL